MSDKPFQSYLHDVKAIPVQQLKQSLELVPHDAWVCVNIVGNLMVMDAQGGYLGFIDFVEGEPTYEVSV